MAIYHLSVKTTSRSDGLSSVARASYRSCENLKDERTGQIYDYNKKSGLVHSEIFTNKDWTYENRSDLWNQIEQTEKRINSTVCREFEFSLPEELNKEKQIILAREFSKLLVERFGFAADLSIHIPKIRKPNADKEHENAHCHLLTSTRTADGKKIRELDDKKSGAIFEVREIWEKICNEHLANAGLDVRISSKKLISLEERKAQNDKSLYEVRQELDRINKELDELNKELNELNRTDNPDCFKKSLEMTKKLIPLPKIPVSELTLLDEYDGEKMFIDNKKEFLLLWHLNKENYEEWFFIKPKDNNLLLHMNNKISLLTLMRNSSLKIATRNYDNYDNFNLTELIPNEETHKFPTDKAFL